MSAEFKPVFPDGMNVRALDICFSLSAIENMVTNILGTLASYTDLYDPQTNENLKQVVKCLVQTRGCINNRFKDSEPWLDTKISAKFESRMVIHGVEGLGQDLFHAFDISDALSHTTGGVTMFLGMEPTIAEPDDDAAYTAGGGDDDDFIDDETYEEFYEDDYDYGYRRRRNKKHRYSGYGSKSKKQRVGGRGRGRIKREPKQPLNRGVYECKKCDASFEKEEFLKQHEEQFVHDKYKCDQCDKLFSWKKEFDKHMEASHGVGPVDVKVSHKVEPRNADQNTITCKQEVVEAAESKPRLSDGYGGGDQAHPVPLVKQEEAVVNSGVGGGGAETAVADDAQNNWHVGLSAEDMEKHLDKSSADYGGGGRSRRADDDDDDDDDADYDPNGRGGGDDDDDDYDEDGGSGKRKRSAVKSEPKPFKKKYRQANPAMECQVCGRLVKRSNLHKHLRIHTGEKPFACNEPGCTKRFISKYNLKQHMFTTHTANREKMLCQNCGAGFLTLPALKKHSCEKTKLAQQKMACKICGKVVKSEVHMRSHMKIHSAERPYTCEVCGEAFRRPYEINIHRIRAHDKPTCDLCASSFTSISSLNRHMQCVHSDLRPFSCDVCGKDYKDKGSLMKHRAIHNKDENIKFKCEMCPKIFYFLKDLRRHYQKVHNIDITADEELDRRHADAGRQAIRAALSRAEFGGHDHRMLSN